MGQYFYIVNLDKKEFLHPHKLGSGLKFWEILSTKVPQVLAYLLRQSNESGGGDITAGKTNGRWARDRIVIIGDYDESDLYTIANETYTDISLLVRKDFEDLEDFSLGKRWDKD